jgi:hypothetical protein
MSIRDPRWVPTSQLLLAVASSLQIANFAAQDSHSSLGWVVLALSVIVLAISTSLVLWYIWKRDA